MATVTVRKVPNDDYLSLINKPTTPTRKIQLSQSIMADLTPKRTKLVSAVKGSIDIGFPSPFLSSSPSHYSAPTPTHDRNVNYVVKLKHIYSEVHRRKTAKQKRDELFERMTKLTEDVRILKEAQKARDEMERLVSTFEVHERLAQGSNDWIYATDLKSPDPIFSLKVVKQLKIEHKSYLPHLLMQFFVQDALAIENLPDCMKSMHQNIFNDMRARLESSKLAPLSDICLKVASKLVQYSKINDSLQAAMECLLANWCAREAYAPARRSHCHVVPTIAAAEEIISQSPYIPDYLRGTSKSFASDGRLKGGEALFLSIICRWPCPFTSSKGYSVRWVVVLRFII